MELLAHWPLSKDGSDIVGGLHAVAQAVDFSDGAAHLNGIDSALTVSHHPALQLGTHPFALHLKLKCHGAKPMSYGEVISKFDTQNRNGFSLRIGGSKPGYSSLSDARHLHAAIDNNVLSSWQDHGKPWPSNTLISTLTVFDGHLYTGIADALPHESTPAIFRWRGADNWEFCGQLDVDPRTRSVMSMLVHQGALYAGTGCWNWDKSLKGNCGPTHVFRYEGGTSWHDCGTFGDGKRVLALASFNGELYAGDDRGMVYRFAGDQHWEWCGQLGQHDRVNAMMVWRGRLYGAPHGAIFRYEGGTEWTCVGGLPDRRDGLFNENQTHTLQVYDSHLWAGMWPQGKVLRYEAPGRWSDTGQMGIARHINEINDLAVYNGKLYAGALPLAEVYRYDGDHNWCKVGQLVHNAALDADDIWSWNRAPCLTVYQGRLFAGTSTCHGDANATPHPQVGRVYSLAAGCGVAYEHDLGTAWHDIVFAREHNCLSLSIDGREVSRSDTFNATDFDLNNTVPLQFGVGPQSHFAGAVKEIKLWR